MISRYLDKDFPTLSLTDTGRQALEPMNDAKTKWIPVKRDSKLVGLLAEEEAYHHLDYSLSTDFLLQNISVDVRDHILEAVELMHSYQLDIIPVQEKENYIGVIRYSDVINYIAQTQSTAVKGSYIIIEMPIYSYSMSEISTIFEAEGVKILSSAVEFDEEDTSLIRIHIKTSAETLDSIVKHLERHKFKIVEIINDARQESVLQERYDSLMSYLNV